MLPAPAPKVDQLTREIHHYEDLAISHAANAVRFRIEIGKRLNQAKAILPHGQFLPWCADHFKWSRRHVHNHMQLARNAQRVAHLPDDISLRMALEATRSTAASAPRPPEHMRLAIKLETGEEAVLELRSGDLESLCKTLQARKVPFRKVLTVKAA